MNNNNRNNMEYFIPQSPIHNNAPCHFTAILVRRTFVHLIAFAVAFALPSQKIIIKNEAESCVRTEYDFWRLRQNIPGILLAGG